MPSPVGHSLMGYIIYRIAARPIAPQRLQLITLYLFAANGPDLDFIPGFIIGNPIRYHHGISHSIGFSVLFASIFSLLLFLLKRDSIGKNFPIFFSLYSSHIGMDYLGMDTTPPYGEPLLWPLRDKYYIATFAFLPEIKRVSSSTVTFIVSLFSVHNLWAVTIELILLFPFVLIVLLLDRKPSISEK